MKKGGEVSETFDEHERDTAQRAYPKEVVDASMLTTKISAFDLDSALRGESGTRPAISDDKIEKHVRENMEEAFQSSMASSVQKTQAEAREIDPDPHSRPTIDVIPRLQTIKLAPIPTPVMEMAVSPRPSPKPAPSSSPAIAVASPASAFAPASQPPASSPQPDLITATAAGTSSAGPISISRQMLMLMIAGVVVLVLAAGAVGFFLGQSRPI